jgi:cyclophilin family peptidyl-prolyl cis-trans isomerase/HEAT repeat protein
MRKIFCLALIVGVYSIQFAQFISPKEREILQLQDQRSLGEGKLVSYLRDGNERLRYRAAIALANIQNPATIETLAISMKDPSNKVRAAAAFALGQIGSQQADEALLSAVSKEKDAMVLSRILEAIGKSSSSRSLDSVLNLDAMKQRLFPVKDIALCIARFAIRQIKTERSIWKCFDLIQHKSPDVRSAALFALWRSAPHGLIDLEISKEKDRLIRLAKDSDPMIRMHLATLLSRSKSKDAVEILNALEQTEQKTNDWHVWVQIVRARTSLAAADKNVFMKYPQYLGMKNDQVKISALQALATMPSKLISQSDEVDSIRQMICGYAGVQSGENETVRGEALVTLGKHFPDELNQFHSWIADTQVTQRLKAKLLEGIAQQITREHLNILLAHLNHESIRVAMAAWDFVKPMLISVANKSLDFDSTTEFNLLRNVFENASIALAKRDMGLTTVIANLFDDTVVWKYNKDHGLNDKIIDAFMMAFDSLKNPGDAEAKQSIIRALETMDTLRVVPFLENVLSDPDAAVAAEAAASLHRLTGKNYSARLAQYTIPKRTEEDWNLLESILPDQKVHITTNKGVIILELMKEHAPFTVLNFVKLIKNHFYDGLCFHRVVPNFVVQGGDPRGDGWGGPGYTMRTEVSLVNYNRGSCGMASAGKDTEGCQFFITHISTPHLDGRYTIFARVVKGMEVADRLQIGDTIQSVQIVR